MYLILDSSTTVGSTITVVNKTVVTVPDDLTIESTSANSANLINKNGNESIYIEDMGKQNTAKDLFENQLSKNKKGMKIISNSTTKINDNPVYRIDAQNITSKKNITFTYAYVANHTFSIKINDYTDAQKISLDLNFLIKNMRPDYKQSQD